MSDDHDSLIRLEERVGALERSQSHTAGLIAAGVGIVMAVVALVVAIAR